MVNRVDGVGNYQYPEVRNVNTKANESTMNMDYGQTSVQNPYEAAGVIYEPVTGPAQATPKVDEAEELGVRLDLSKNSVATVNPDKEAVVEETFGETVKRIFYSAIEAIKSFAKAIWEGDETEKLSAELTDENLRSQAAEKGFMTAEERLAQLLKEDNRGTLVKNSDLLTYYDRSGHIASMDPSDKSKILNGTGKDIVL